MFQRWNSTYSDLPYLKRHRIGVQPVARNESSRIIFSFPFSSCWRTRGTNKKRAFLTRHSGSDGRGCCESIIMPMGCGRKHAYSPEFQKFLSGTRSPDELGSLNDLFDFVQQ